MRFLYLLVPVVCAAFSAGAQNPLRAPADAAELRFARSQPIVHYTLRVDSMDLGGFAVEMRIRNAPDTLQLAMSAHPEYDDKYWRYLEDLRIESPSGGATITRADSSVWRVQARGGESVVRYRIRFPAAAEGPRSAWRPFLSPTSGLVGGPHAFMYIVGQTLIPSHARFVIPRSWTIATGLTPTADPATFFAPSADVLLESPAFVGKFSDWRFAVDGVPHRIIYWRTPAAVSFDTVEFVRGIRGIAQQSIALFGRAPWREYTFIYQDGALGGLEHANSVTLGAPSAQLAANPHAHLLETAHEFFHAWNLKRIRPAEYRDVDYLVQPPTSSLWFSEGLTIFYAHLLRWRGQLPGPDSTRIAHLETILTRYAAAPGHSRLSAERVSRAAYNTEPDALGDYTASTHLQGEVIGTMLDIIIRDATDGRRSMDDVMRLMLERFSAERGFLGADIERTVEDVCGCDVTPFFDAHVRGATPIDFDRYLRLIGLQMITGMAPLLNAAGAPALDLGVWAWTRASDGTLRIKITNPDNAWGRAGLHTGDRLYAVNGTPMTTAQDFRAKLVALRIGDTIRLDVENAKGRSTVSVTGVALVQPFVRIAPSSVASPKAALLFAAWRDGK